VLVSVLVVLRVVIPDSISEDVSAWQEKISEVLGDEFVTMLLVGFVAIVAAHPKFADVVKECGEV
jgi:predicted histidine transporter YuiF (NhaC family)